MTAVHDRLPARRRSGARGPRRWVVALEHRQTGQRVTRQARALDAWEARQAVYRSLGDHSAGNPRRVWRCLRIVETR